MPTNKDLEGKKDTETQEDVDTKEGLETGERSIEYLVEGLMTEEELQRVSGGVIPGLGIKAMECNLCSGVVVPHCVSYHCGSFDPSKDRI